MHGVLPRGDHNEDNHMLLTTQLAPFLLRHCYLSIFCTLLPVLGEHVVYPSLNQHLFAENFLALLFKFPVKSMLSVQLHTSTDKEFTHAKIIFRYFAHRTPKKSEVHAEDLRA